MSPLWITLHWRYGNGRGQRGNRYSLQTHFTQPIRSGTKREWNYEWWSPSPEHTSNDYEKLTEIPKTIWDLIKEASVAYGADIRQQFTSGEIALKISDEGVTVFKPYDKSKNKAQSTVNEPVLHKETPMTKDTIQSDPLLPAIEIKTQLYDAETLAGGQKCESFI